MGLGVAGIAELPGEDVDTSAFVADEFVGAVCRFDPRMFDIDAHGTAKVVTAVLCCYSCPVLARCARYLATIEPPPVGVVWAGQVLDHEPNRNARWHRAFARTISRYTEPEKWQPGTVQDSIDDSPLRKPGADVGTSAFVTGEYTGTACAARRIRICSTTTAIMNHQAIIHPRCSANVASRYVERRKSVIGFLERSRLD